MGTIPADIRELVQRINSVVSQGPRYGCQFTVNFEGLPNVGIYAKSFSLPKIGGSEASEFVMGTEIDMSGIPQFGGSEGFPCQIKVRKGGKTIKEIIQRFYSRERIPKTIVELSGVGETPVEFEKIAFYGGKISVDPTSLEDDANTENLVLEGTFKYLYWLPE